MKLKRIYGRVELGYLRGRARNWHYISHGHSFPPWSKDCFIHEWMTNTRLGLRNWYHQFQLHRKKTVLSQLRSLNILDMRHSSTKIF